MSSGCDRFIFCCCSSSLFQIDKPQNKKLTFSFWIGGQIDFLQIFLRGIVRHLFLFSKWNRLLSKFLSFLFSTTDIQRGQRLENFFSNKRFFPSLSLYLPFSLLFSKLFTRPHLSLSLFHLFLLRFLSCSAFRLTSCVTIVVIIFRLISFAGVVLFYSISFTVRKDNII